eukprot:TRINITY_DN1467_c0_g1_i1.p1 TRINITY_DN1467_c0_g1~~TRINITY_DN1467_c0_g1_i1.p1  ORF type:complete len:683 (+),score=99.75 TRINITY_DN1467_c0_g1_i1:131-2179(+)
MEADAVTQQCINTIRCLSADQVQAANSGHPGAPMGMAPIAHILWSHFLRFNPANPKWLNRDRFVLSNGHACALLYSMLHLTGYDLSVEDLKSFRKVGSKTPGHPEANFHTPGVEVSTGPLGQGLTNAVGLAIAGAHLAAEYNTEEFTLFNNHTFVFCGDGCLQEGVTSEASSIAGHLGLGNLIVLYDDNNITIDGECGLSFTEDVMKRYESYGWHVQYVANGDSDYDGIIKAVEEAKKVTDRPSLIKIKTTIGFSAKKQGTEAVHGSPLGAEELASVKQKLGLDPSKHFYVPDAVAQFYSQFKKKGADAEAEWTQLFEKFRSAHPERAAELQRRVDAKLPENWEKDLPSWKPEDSAIATRQASGIVLNKLAERLPELFGGSADLNPSCLTYLKSSVDFQKNSFKGRNVRFGVREHAMAGICNGITAYGGLLPFCSTFLNFIGYAWGSVILSALTEYRVLYIMTHDSIGLGEDGPTHQPIEKYAMCRSLPNMLFLRPADGNETTGAYVAALHHPGPTVIALSRQGLPHLEKSSVENTLKGGYVVNDTSHEGAADLIFVSTGSEVSLCLEAAKQLAPLKIRVVSLVSWELFEKNDIEYKTNVFAGGRVPVVSVEAGIKLGWDRYSHYHCGMDTFGHSGPAKDVYAKVGLTASVIAKTARAVLRRAETAPVPLLPALLPPLDLAD